MEEQDQKSYESQLEDKAEWLANCGEPPSTLKILIHQNLVAAYSHGRAERGEEDMGTIRQYDKSKLGAIKEDTKMTALGSVASSLFTQAGFRREARLVRSADVADDIESYVREWIEGGSVKPGETDVEISDRLLTEVLDGFADVLPEEESDALSEAMDAIGSALDEAVRDGKLKRKVQTATLGSVADSLRKQAGVEKVAYFVRMPSEGEEPNIERSIVSTPEELAQVIKQEMADFRAYKPGPDDPAKDLDMTPALDALDIKLQQVLQNLKMKAIDFTEAVDRADSLIGMVGEADIRGPQDVDQYVQWIKEASLNLSAFSKVAR